MPVISFPVFVIVAENTFFMNNIRQTVLKGVIRSRQRLDKSPEHEFRISVFSIYDALAQ